MKRFSLKGLLFIITIVCFWLVLAGLAWELARVKSRYSNNVSLVPPVSGCHLNRLSHNDIFIGVGTDTVVRVRLMVRENGQEREIGRTTVFQGSHVLSFFHNRVEGQVGYCIAGEVQMALGPSNAPPAVTPAMNIYTAPEWETLWKVNAQDWSEVWTVEVQEEQIAQ